MRDSGGGSDEGGGGGGKLLVCIKNSAVITELPKGHAELQSIFSIGRLRRKMNTSVNYQPRNPDGFACFHKACIVQSETRCVLNPFFFPFGLLPVKEKKKNVQDCRTVRRLSTLFLFYRIQRFKVVFVFIMKIVIIILIIIIYYYHYYYY